MPTFSFTAREKKILHFNVCHLFTNNYPGKVMLREKEKKSFFLL